MNKVKYIISVLAIGSAVYTLSSCQKDPASPGVEFMPDMYRSPSYETYSSNPNFEDGLSARVPAKGTIAQGYMPYALANDTSGYAMSGRIIKNPLARTEDNLKEGEVLYGKFCVHCHGATGEGDGLVGQKLPGAPPAYASTLKDLPEGKIFHSITYGKGLMGSHASQLSQDERWKLVLYVQKLQHPGDKAFEAGASGVTQTDSVKAVAPVAIDSVKTVVK